MKSFAGQMKRCKEAMPSFMKKVSYFSANYDSKEDFARLAVALETEETQMLPGCHVMEKEDVICLLRSLDVIYSA